MTRFLKRTRAFHEQNLDELSELLAQVLPRYVEEPNASKYFQFWEEHGFHLTPVHFYQPIPDTRTLTDDLWEKDSDLAGVDMNEAGQMSLLRDVFPRFQSEYNQIPTERTASSHEFYMDNGMISGTDALVLYCMVRYFHPNVMIEVGSGFSTRLSAQAGLKNGNTELICIEPYPDVVLTKGFPGLTRLIPKKVQEVGLDFFLQLSAGDILFVDSSHVVRCGGDVNYLFLEVFPRLKPGVVVHLHDIFLPREFPKEWLLGHHWFWTEQYLLHAFLLHNSAFEVLFANTFMGLKHNEEMQATFPKSPWWGGGSFWMRRKIEIE